MNFDTWSIPSKGPIHDFPGHKRRDKYSTKDQVKGRGIQIILIDTSAAALEIKPESEFSKSDPHRPYEDTRKHQKTKTLKPVFIYLFFQRI